MLSVRPATPNDADALCDAHVGGWREAYRGLFPDAYLDAEEFESSRRAMWRRAEWLDVPDVDMLVGSIDGRVLGFAYCGPERIDGGAPGAPRASGARGEVYSFYLRAAAWGSGLAGALMLRSEAAMRDRGSTEAVLWVLRDNPRARAFYEKAGWSWSGRETLWNAPTIVGAPEPPPVAEVHYIRHL